MFLESPSFPACPNFGAQGQPMYSVTVVQMTSGRERRNRNWLRSLLQFDCTIGPRAADTIQEILEWWHAMGGMECGFRFRDWTDYKSCRVNQTPTNVDQPMVQTVDVRTFQMVKHYTKGARTQVRNIVKPVEGTILVSDNAVALAEGADYTIDYTAGVISFSVAPTTPKWGGEFDVPVRFNSEFPVQVSDFEVQTVQFSLQELRSPLDDGIGVGAGPGVWIARTSGFGSSAIQSVAYGGGKFVAVGDGGKVSTSPDGVTWTPRTTAWLGAVTTITGIIWDGSKFVAVGYDATPVGYAGTSADGITWSVAALPTNDQNAPSCVSFGAGVYVIGCNGTGSTLGNYWTSPDAATWTARNTFNSSGFFNMIFDGVDFVAGVRSAAGSHPVIAYSADGITWSTNSVTSFGTLDPPLVASNGTSLYVSVDNNRNKAEKSPSRVWSGTAENPGLDDVDGISCITFGAGLFIACDYTAAAASSANGVAWTAEALNFAGGESAYCITYGGGKFVAAGSNGQLSTRAA